MKILREKGDLSLCKNWRAICLLDIASKILSTVIVARMHSKAGALGQTTVGNLGLNNVYELFHLG